MVLLPGCVCCGCARLAGQFYDATTVNLDLSVGGYSLSKTGEVTSVCSVGNPPQSYDPCGLPVGSIFSSTDYMDGAAISGSIALTKTSTAQGSQGATHVFSYSFSKGGYQAGYISLTVAMVWPTGAPAPGSLYSVTLYGEIPAVFAWSRTSATTPTPSTYQGIASTCVCGAAAPAEDSGQGVYLCYFGKEFLCNESFSLDSIVFSEQIKNEDFLLNRSQIPFPYTPGSVVGVGAWASFVIPESSCSVSNVSIP